MVVHAYSFNTGQDEARAQQFEAILDSVVKKKNSFFALGASHISIQPLSLSYWSGKSRAFSF